MFDHILVPVDGSDEAVLGLGPATALAYRTGAPLHVLALHRAGEDPGALEATILDQLGAVADLPRVIDVRPIERSVAEDIRTVASRNSPCLIVMGSRGRGRSAAILGSVANDILNHAGQPVLLVGPASIAGRFRTHGPALVSVSGGDDRELLDAAAALFATTDLEPVIVHVIDPDMARRLDQAHTGPTGSDFPMETATAERAAHLLEASTDRTDIDFDAYHEKHPARAIVEQASTRRASLIIMATHARHGLDRLSYGSVTADVVREAPCPVLVTGLEE